MDRRGLQLDSKSIDPQLGRTLITFRLPLIEIVVDFYDKLKSITSGYASFDYEEIGYEPSSLVKVCCPLHSHLLFCKLHHSLCSLQLTIMLNGNLVEEMTTIAHASKAKDVGKGICQRLRDTIPRHQFQVIPILLIQY